MSEYVTELECDDCGNVAAEKTDGIWTDGEEVACSCGTRWVVSFDSEAPDVWLTRVEE